MDNAQKAIMIGVGLFITIIIISAVLLITNIGTNLVTDAQSQLSGISTSLQNQVTNAYDGKTMSGSEVIAACQQYENSDKIAIKIFTSESVSFQTGKYAVELTGDVTGRSAGGINVDSTKGEGKAYVELTSSTRNTLSRIQGTDGVSGTQTYYSYVMKDKSSQQVVGILFVRKDVTAKKGVEVTTG